MNRIIKIMPLAGFRLAVWFDDGVAGTIELTSKLFGPVFELLRDEALFSQVCLDEFGAPCWPNGADLAPDAIYAQLNGPTDFVNFTKPEGFEQRKGLTRQEKATKP